MPPKGPTGGQKGNISLSYLVYTYTQLGKTYIFEFFDISISSVVTFCLTYLVQHVQSGECIEALGTLVKLWIDH